MIFTSKQFKSISSQKVDLKYLRKLLAYKEVPFLFKCNFFYTQVFLHDVTVLDKIYYFGTAIVFKSWISVLKSFIYIFFVFSSYYIRKSYFSIFLDNTKRKIVWIKITTFFKRRVSIILWSFHSMMEMRCYFYPNYFSIQRTFFSCFIIFLKLFRFSPW